MSPYRASLLPTAKVAPAAPWWRRLRAWWRGTFDALALRRAGLCSVCRVRQRAFPGAPTRVREGCGCVARVGALCPPKARQVAATPLLLPLAHEEYEARLRRRLELEFPPMPPRVPPVETRE